MFYPSLIPSLLIGGISAVVARNKGKNPYLWFFLGSFFGIFGLLFLIFSDRIMKQPRKGARKFQNDPTTIDITPTIDPQHKETFWYYLDEGNEQKGPMSYDALTHAFKEGKIYSSTLVWNENLTNWQHLGDFLKSS